MLAFFPVLCEPVSFIFSGSFCNTIRIKTRVEKCWCVTCCVRDFLVLHTHHMEVSHTVVVIDLQRLSPYPQSIAPNVPSLPHDLPLLSPNLLLFSPNVHQTTITLSPNLPLLFPDVPSLPLNLPLLSLNLPSRSVEFHLIYISFT